MIRKETDFPFLGQRDYLHGTSVVSAIADLLEVEGQCPALIKRIKFQRPMRCNGVLVLESADSSTLDTSEASCIFTARTANRQWKGAFVEQGRAIRNRISVQYDLNEFTYADFGGGCRLRAHGRTEYIRAFVEANKRFHLGNLDESGADAKVRFGYLENWEAGPIDEEFSGFLEAKNLIVQQTKEGIKTINRLTYSDKVGQRNSFDICFDINLPGNDSQ